MIELSNIIGFIGLAGLLIGLEWFLYSGKRRTLMVIPVAIVFSAIINLAIYYY